MGRACDQVAHKIIPDKFCEHLIICLIAFSKLTCLEVPICLISEYTKLDDDAIQLTSKSMNTPIRGEALLNEFVEKIE